jgi:tetratricopeptide (TPR) repeat protein
MRDFVRNLESEVNEARKRGDIPSLIAIASAAMDKLEAAAGTARGTLDENQFLALKAAKRVGYNAAADIWPGWEIAAPTRSEAELQSAQALAQRSSALVDKLNQGPVEHGNAIWLIGALYLARGRYEEALEAFRAATRFYADAPVVKLLSEGYMAIAAELSSTVKGTTAFDSVIARLHELSSEDAKAFREQLQIARQVFAPHKVEGLPANEIDTDAAHGFKP